MVDRRTRLCRDVVEQLREVFGDEVFQTEIPRNDSPGRGAELWEACPTPTTRSVAVRWPTPTSRSSSSSRMGAESTDEDANADDTAMNNVIKMEAS